MASIDFLHTSMLLSVLINLLTLGGLNIASKNEPFIGYHCFTHHIGIQHKYTSHILEIDTHGTKKSCFIAVATDETRKLQTIFMFSLHSVVFGCLVQMITSMHFVIYSFSNSPFGTDNISPRPPRALLQLTVTSFARIEAYCLVLTPLISAKVNASSLRFVVGALS